MESYKIEHYEREHGSGSFPGFRSLSVTEARRIYVAVIRAAGLLSCRTAEELVLAVRDMSILEEGVQVESVDFSLLDLIRKLGLPTSKKVYLNWYRYDKIDEINTVDLAEHFDDIWYPSVDDLDVIDGDIRWQISISHYGAVTWLLLGRENGRKTGANKGE